MEVRDKNIAYFFQKVNGHRAMNKVMSISSEDGERIVGEKNVHKEAIRYFHQFLGSTQQYNSYLGRLNQVIDKKLNGEQKSKLTVEVTNDEIIKALFSISNKKAPSPDGYSANFLRRIGI